MMGRACLLVCLIALAACRTTVPEPTMKLGASERRTPAYSLHNIGPQRIHESFSAYFVDLDQDDHIDLLIGGRDPVQGFHVEWGDGKGNWSRQEGPSTGMEPRAFSVADADRDGVQEVLIAGQGDQKGLQVWKIGAKGQDWKLHSTPIEGGSFHDAMMVDINEDGWPDIIAARADTEKDGGIYIWLNNGQGGWVADVGPMVEGVFTDLAVADINADGHLDIAASRRGGVGAKRVSGDTWRQVGGIQIWYGDGSGRWEPEVLSASSDAESVTVADVNGDGKLDVVAGMYQTGIHVWLASSGGWQRSRLLDRGSWGALRIGDLDGNGKRELVAASLDGRGLAVWSWTGGGFVARKGWLPDKGVYLDIDLGDVRGVGLLDVAVIRADGGVEIWSGKKAKPQKAKTIVSSPVGKPLSVYFPSASAMVNAAAMKQMKHWLASLGRAPNVYLFKVEGRADMRPVHSEIFPNNLALSRARAEALAAWLRSQGVPAKNITVQALGDSDPIPSGMNKEALRQNRRVIVQAFAMSDVRTPATTGKAGHGDLYHVNANHVFETVNNIPEYRVGPGDELSLTMWQGGKGTEHKVVVQIDGTVSLPYHEALHVNGLTPRKIDALLTRTLAKYERHPRVDVRVLKARSKTASIFGQVQSLVRQPTGPGSYFLFGRETLVDLLSRAGGPTKDADLTKVQIIRKGKTILLNLDRAIRQGDWSENAIIDEGDTIYIPSLAQSKRRIYVLGEVEKPGIVEFTGDIKLLDAISERGGFGKDAYYPDIRVLRANRDSPQILAVSFDRLLEKGDLAQNLALKDKDVIIVPRRPIGNWNRFIKDITPSLDLLLFKPATLAYQILLIEDISKRVP